jgi:hypothetical protein
LPSSEAEIKAVSNYLLDKVPKWEIYFGLHSYGQYWLTPFSYSIKQIPENFKETVNVKTFLNYSEGFFWHSPSKVPKSKNQLFILTRSIRISLIFLKFFYQKKPPNQQPKFFGLFGPTFLARTEPNVRYELNRLGPSRGNKNYSILQVQNFQTFLLFPAEPKLRSFGLVREKVD